MPLMRTDFLRDGFCRCCSVWDVFSISFYLYFGKWLGFKRNDMSRPKRRTTLRGQTSWRFAVPLTCTAKTHAHAHWGTPNKSEKREGSSSARTKALCLRWRHGRLSGFVFYCGGTKRDFAISLSGFHWGCSMIHRVFIKRVFVTPPNRLYNGNHCTIGYNTIVESWKFTIRGKMYLFGLCIVVGG